VASQATQTPSQTPPSGSASSRTSTWCIAPFKDLDSIVGNTSPVLQKCIAHPTPDTKARHYLIIGPWDHAGTRTPKKEVGGLTFGEASILDLNRLHKRWYDWNMKGGIKPEFLKKRVTSYVPGTGAENRKYADTLETIPNSTRRLFLSSQNGSTSSAFHSGELSEKQPGIQSPHNYIYDPLDTRPAAREQKDIPNGLTDQSAVLSINGEGLIYQGEPFTEDTEITGYVQLVAWMSMDVPDTDFVAEHDEIMQNGTSVQWTSDLMRARYRDSLTAEKLVKPGEINRYEFVGFTFLSRHVAKASRLRLKLTAPDSIQIEHDYNAGGAVAAESRRDTRTAHIRLYHDAQPQSLLEIPIVK
jgi:uncharacterized protein